MNTNAPDTVALIKRSANIVLIGYDALNAAGFDKRFNEICQMEGMQDFSFEKENFKLIFEGRIPENAIKNFVFPISKYVDKKNDLFVEYNDTANKLQVQDETLEHRSLFKNLVKIILEEQANKLTAIGFNFIYRYKCDASPTKILDATAEALKSSAFSGKSFNQIGVSFAYQDGKYIKSFRIDRQENSEFTIMGNYNFDKFKDTRSTRVIRDAVLDEIISFDNLVEEFNSLSSGIIRA